jgi:hypothetical protein
MGVRMAEGVSYFAVKSIGLSRCNGRKPCSLLDAARHNLREIQAEQGAKGHIDPRHCRRNNIMAGPRTAASVHALSVALLAPVDTARLKRDHCQAIEAVFSLPSGAGINATAYFARCIEWLAQVLPLPLLSAVVHHDEATPHLHALLLPVRDGRHVGSAPIARPELKRLRESFFAQVAGPFGLKREGAKLRGAMKKLAVEAVLRVCDAEGWRVATGPLWPVLQAAIVRDPTKALLQLGIDPNGIRPANETPLRPVQPSPIGLVQTSIGLHNNGQTMQALSCVGLGPAHHSRSSPKLNATVADLGAVVGCKLAPSAYGAFDLERLDALRVDNAPHTKASRTERHALSRAVTPSAMTRYARQPQESPLRPAGRVGDDGFTRECDEHCHDLSAWNE